MKKASIDSPELQVAAKAKYKKCPMSTLLIDENQQIIDCDENFMFLSGFQKEELIERQLEMIIPDINAFKDKNTINESLIKIASTEQVRCNILNADLEFVSVMMEVDILEGTSLRSVYFIDERIPNSISFQVSYPFQVSNIGQALVREGFKLVACNKAYEVITGYSENELRELKTEKLVLPEYLGLINKYHTEEFKDKGGSSSNIYTIGISRKDGTPITIDLQIEKMPGHDLDRCYIRRVYNADSNGFKLSKITNQRDGYWSALNNSALISVTDANGIILLANDKFCEVSGYKKEELIGSSHNILNSSFHSQSFWRGMWATISSGRPWRAEVRNRTKLGKFYWVDTTINPILDSKGEVEQYLSVRYLITRRKEMEEDQEALLKNLADYAFLTSHNLRGPMARIQGLINLYTGGHLSLDEETESLGMLKGALLELDTITREMNRLLNRGAGQD